MKIRVKNGPEVTDSELEEMYQIRAHFMDLKPDVPRDKDFNSFCKAVKKAKIVYQFKAEDGSIKGFYIVDYYVERNSMTGKKRLIVEPEYGFILEEYQGKYLSKTTRKNAIRTFIQYPFLKKYLLGPAYPASYFTLQKYSGAVWSWLDNDIPEDVKDVLYTYAQRHDLVENGEFSGVKKLYTVPRKTTPVHIERLKKNPLYTRYMSQNPDWQKGYGLITVCVVGLHTILKGKKK